MFRRGLAFIALLAVALSSAAPTAAASGSASEHACCVRIDDAAGCGHRTISCCPAPLGPLGQSQVPPTAGGSAAGSPLVLLATHPVATLHDAADAGGGAGTTTLFAPRVSDTFDPIYLRHGVLLV
jgi:hypothetical protein